MQHVCYSYVIFYCIQFVLMVLILAESSICLFVFLVLTDV